ncbi:MAG TPA: hypothetical protein ENH85_00725 [Candidatus Scalindua sp.]|nr:hypothetical protein [Candidatus Scalindua sp.]
MNRLRVKLNADLGQFKKGAIIELVVDENGMPMQRFWYRRFKDAKIDNCIEVIEEEKNTGGTIKKSKKNKED